MSFAFLTLSCRCARSGHGTQGSQARLPRLFLYPPATSLLFSSFFFFFLLFLASRPVASRGVTRRHMTPSGLNISSPAAAPVGGTSRGWISTNFVPDYRHHMWPTLLFVVGADHSVRCFVIARALCLLQRPPSTPHRVRSVRGCLGCSSWSDVASDLVRRFSAGASGFPRVPTKSGGWMAPGTSVVCCVSSRLLLIGRRSIARVPGGNAGRISSRLSASSKQEPKNKPHKNSVFGTRGSLCFPQSA